MKTPIPIIRYKIVIPFYAYEPQYLNTPVIHYCNDEIEARKLTKRISKAYELSDSLRDSHINFARAVLSELGLLGEGYIIGEPKLFVVSETEITQHEI